LGVTQFSWLCHSFLSGGDCFVGVFAVRAHWGYEEEGGYLFAYCLEDKIKISSAVYGVKAYYWGWLCHADVSGVLQKECDDKHDCYLAVDDATLNTAPCKTAGKKLLTYSWYCFSDGHYDE